MSLGHTRQLPIEDRYLLTRGQCKDMLATFLGGHTAEELIFNEMTTGAQDDIKRATDWARKMVTDFGMSDRLGPRTFGDKQELVFLGREISEQKDYGDKIADLIDEEIDRIIQNAYTTARKVVSENKAKLMRLAQKLIAEETVEGAELEASFAGGTSAVSETSVSLAPMPAEAPSKSEPAAKPKRPRVVPHPLPEAPAASD